MISLMSLRLLNLVSRYSATNLGWLFVIEIAYKYLLFSRLVFIIKPNYKLYLQLLKLTSYLFTINFSLVVPALKCKNSQKYCDFIKPQTAHLSALLTETVSTLIIISVSKKLMVIWVESRKKINDFCTVRRRNS